MTTSGSPADQHQFCALLRGDLVDLLPGDARAVSLSRRVVTLAEILDREDVPALAGASPGVVATSGATPARAAPAQPHCHQHAILGMGAERGHEAISHAVAELALLPALEHLDAEALVLADGFSCRTQIEALSGRRARHLAEMLADMLPGVALEGTL